MMDKYNPVAGPSSKKNQNNLQPLPPPPPDPVYTSKQAKHVKHENINVFDEAFQSESGRSRPGPFSQQRRMGNFNEKDKEILDCLMSLNSKLDSDISHSDQMPLYHPEVKKEFTAKYSESAQKTPPISEENERAKLDKQLESITHPLLLRTASTFAATLATEDAFDHLDKLYKLMDQLLSLKEQNSKLHQRVRDLEQFKILQKMHLKVETDARAGKIPYTEAMQSETIDPELDFETAYTENLLDTILAAGRTATVKRNTKWKGPCLRQSIMRRQRSKSIGMEDPQPSGSGDPEFRSASHAINASRRQSSTDPKSKVSKWTKVKAAFKWEKASTSVSSGLHETKSQDSGLGGMMPINNEVARYLRVPSVSVDPNSGGGHASPADSVFSGSSGALGRHPQSDLSVPATPGTLSSASSAEELNMGDAYKSGSGYCPQRCASAADARAARLHPPGRRLSESRSGPEDEARRSRSLDGDASIGSSSFLVKHLTKEEESKSKPHKTPWGKVKDILQTHRHSLKSKPRRNSVKSQKNSCSEDRWSVSSEHDLLCPAESAEISVEGPRIEVSSETPQPMDTEELIPPKRDSLKRLTPTLTVTMPSTEELRSMNNLLLLDDIHESRPNSKMEGERSPSGASPGGNRKPPVHSLNLHTSKQELTDTEHGSPLLQRKDSKWAKVKRAFLSGSVPSSPNVPQNHTMFFNDMDIDEISSGDYSEPTTPSKPNAPLRLPSVQIKDEIRRNYEELQKKLSQEFNEKILEWEKMKTGPSGSGFHIEELQRELLMSQRTGNLRSTGAIPKLSYRDYPTREENLSADFKKKLDEWQRIKKQQRDSVSGTREEVCSSPTPFSASSSKKKITDWQLWKTSSVKYENQMQNAPVRHLPDQKDLSDDFRKKWDEWKRLKATKSVPSYTYYDEDRDRKQKQVKSVRSSARSPDQENLIDIRNSQPVAGQNRNNQRNSKKYKDKDKEWLDKELQKVHRQRDRLDRERDKYIEREERLTILRRAVDNANAVNKEVLVQTSTGFFRFPGISRKFTRRLYEWEIARGIGPEASTFALLHPGYRPLQMERAPSHTDDNGNDRATPRLVRSLSAGSVANGGAQPSPTISHQLSSLSLNDMDEIEACLADSRDTSDAENNDNQNGQNEPEAVIVDVEDEIVETAAPLVTVTPVVEHQTPVYKYANQEVRVLCEGEECIGPAVQRGRSTHPILEHLENAEKQLKLLQSEPKLKSNQNEEEQEGEINRNSPIVSSLTQFLREIRQTLPNFLPLITFRKPDNKAAIVVNADYLVKHIELIEERVKRNESVTKELDQLQRNIGELKNALTTADFNTDYELQNKVKINQNTIHTTEEGSVTSVTITPAFLKKKQSLDLTEDIRSAGSMASLSSTSTICDESYSKGSERNDKTIATLGAIPKTYEKDESSKDDSSKVNINKRKQKLKKSNNEKLKLSISDSDSEVEAEGNTEQESLRRQIMKRKLLRTKKLSEEKVESDGGEDVVYVLKIKPGQIIEQSKLSSSPERTPSIRSTRSNDSFRDSIGNISGTGSIVGPAESIISLNSSVFVKTTRKLFSPINNGKTSAVAIDLDETDCTSERNKILDIGEIVSHVEERKERAPFEGDKEIVDAEIFKKGILKTQSLSNLPPLPQSPNTTRRESHKLSKETAPSIRKIIEKYSENFDESGQQSPKKNGQASPVQWRSPVAERRVRAQTQRYQNQLRSGSFTGGCSNSEIIDSVYSEVQKSASVGTIRRSANDYTELERTRGVNSPNKLLRGILKSSSAGSIKAQPEDSQKNENKLIEENVTLEAIEYTNKAAAIVSSTAKLQNTPPRISRKYDTKPPSPRLQCKVVRPYTSSLSAPLILDSDLSLSPASRQRAMRIKKAKEDFLAYGTSPIHYPSTSSESPTNTILSPSEITDSTRRSFPLKDGQLDSIKDNHNVMFTQKGSINHFRNRLSQVSVGSESSGDFACSQGLHEDGQLIKSASAGMINVDAQTYRKLSSETHPLGYVSLPRSSAPSGNGSKISLTAGKFGLSNIASKFRKVKLRKNKERDSKMNTVSMLCRQSLLVDINVDDKVAGDGNGQRGSTSQLVDKDMGSLNKLDTKDSKATGKEVHKKERKK